MTIAIVFILQLSSITSSYVRSRIRVNGMYVQKVFKFLSCTCACTLSCTEENTGTTPKVRLRTTIKQYTHLSVLIHNFISFVLNIFVSTRFDTCL